MRILDKTSRRGIGSTVTLTRKNSSVEHNPAPTTERGKRRAAIRRRRRHRDAVLAQSNKDMLTDLGVK